MKITFLGTSAGIPDPDRHCSSTMIEVGERVYVVDAGAPMVDCLRTQGLLMERERAARIAAVFATHSHSDHTVGMLHLLDACTWYFRAACFDVILPAKRLGEKFAECIEIMEGMPFPSDRLRLREASAGVVYDDGVLRATYIPTRHCEPYPSYAILIEAEGKRVLFSGDLSGKLGKQDVPALLSETELDLFICEMAHFTPEELSPYLDTCRARAVCFNHLNPLDKIDRMRALATEKGYPFPIHRAVDGGVLELN
jgi:ribonuclease BN (tRNA processing enzyme)